MTVTNKVRIAFVGRLKNAALSEFLIQKGWSQTQLARELGVALPVVNRWVLLKDMPKGEAILRKLEKLLGQLREDIFPQFFQSDEWQKIRTNLPKEQTVIRELPVRMLLRSGRLSFPSPEEEYDKKELHDCVEQILLTLSQKEAKIIRSHFGLEDGNQQTLKEIGKNIGLSRQRIRGLEQQAFRKLRNPSLNKYLAPFRE